MTLRKAFRFVILSGFPLVPGYRGGKLQEEKISKERMKKREEGKKEQTKARLEAPSAPATFEENQCVFDRAVGRVGARQHQRLFLKITCTVIVYAQTSPQSDQNTA